MDTDALSSMYVQILLDVPKADCPYVTDAESGALWDTVAAEVAAIKAKDPKAQFDIPSELPPATDKVIARTIRSTGKP